MMTYLCQKHFTATSYVQHDLYIPNFEGCSFMDEKQNHIHENFDQYSNNTIQPVETQFEIITTLIPCT